MNTNDYGNFSERRRSYMMKQEKYRDMYKKYLATDGDEHSIDKYYTFDEKGHIMGVTTSKETNDIAPAVSETFQKVMVFFGAWTAALARKNCSLYDYDAVKQIISSSGFFVSMGSETRSYHSDSTEVTLNTAIIGAVLGSDITGGGMEIAKKTLAKIGGQISGGFSEQKTDKEIAHLLFICESLMGMPIVTISLYHTKLDQFGWVQKTNCEEVSRQTIDFKFHSDDYLFVDPDYINKFTEDFEKSDSYEKLIDELAKTLDGPQS
jgi:hypothetical protein